MNFIRLTALIAVTTIAFACNTGYNSKNAEADNIVSLKKEVGLADFKQEEEKSPDREEFYADSTARQQVPRGKTKTTTAKRTGNQT